MHASVSPVKKDLVARYISVLHHAKRLNADDLVAQAASLEKEILESELSMFSRAVEHFLGDEIPLVLSWEKTGGTVLEIPCPSNLEGEDAVWTLLASVFQRVASLGFFFLHIDNLWSKLEDQWDHGLSITDNQVLELLDNSLRRRIYWWTPALLLKGREPQASLEPAPLHGGFLLALTLYSRAQDKLCKYNPVFEPHLHAPHFHQCNSYSLAFAPGFVSLLTTQKTTLG